MNGVAQTFRRTASLAAIAVGALLTGSPARALSVFQTGNTLLTECQSAQLYDRIACYGYATAVADVLAGNAINGFRACVPKSAKVGQVADVAARFLREHPESRHHAANALVAEALATAFPC